VQEQVGVGDGEQLGQRRRGEDAERKDTSAKEDVKQCASGGHVSTGDKEGDRQPRDKDAKRDEPPVLIVTGVLGPLLDDDLLADDPDLRRRLRLRRLRSRLMKRTPDLHLDERSGGGAALGPPSIPRGKRNREERVDDLQDVAVRERR
jgi:hypothetical protein